MSNLSKNVSEMKRRLKAHEENMAKISNNWREAVKKAKEQVKTNTKSEISKIEEKIKSLKNEQNDILAQLENNELQYRKDSARLTEQLKATENRDNLESDKSFEDSRNIRMDRIWNETINSITAILDDHKKKVKQLDLEFTKHMLKRIEINDLRNNEKTLSDIRINVYSRCFNDMNRVTNEIENLNKQIKQTIQHEREKMEKTEQKSFLKEDEERAKETQRFLEKFKSH